jgi:ubiquinone/menaquinone biosynthesis C-methylase UbiE
MFIKDERIDGGTKFDWGRTSSDYAKFRDIYPKEFYDKIIEYGLCMKGQKVLDIGTGTGVIPRNMYKYGAKWTGTDISANQIEQAKILSENMDIQYLAFATEDLDFAENTFDVVTACQCFFYFKHEEVAPILHKIIKPNGSMLVMYMAWLPFEDEVAGASEQLVLKYNPKWTGSGEKMRPIDIPECYNKYFEIVNNEQFYLKVPFTRESWHGRMKACRGIGASLSENEIAMWEAEHKQMLEKMAPPEFEILHYAAFAELKNK